MHVTNDAIFLSDSHVCHMAYLKLFIHDSGTQIFVKQAVVLFVSKAFISKAIPGQL